MLTAILYITADAQGSLKGDGTANFVRPAGGDIVVKGIVFDTWLGVFSNDSTETGTTDLLDIRGCQFLTIGLVCVLTTSDHLTRRLLMAITLMPLRVIPLRIGHNVYADQDNWQRVSITNNVAVNIDATGASDASFCLIYGKFADISHNYIEDIDTDSGEAWGIYTKCRYANIAHNEINDITTVSGAVYGINIKGSERGTTTSPQGFAVNCSNNTLLSTTANGRGIRVQNDDVLVDGNIIEGFQVGLETFTGTQLTGISFSDNKVICPNTTAGTYGINLIGQCDELSCTGNYLDHPGRLAYAVLLLEQYRRTGLLKTTSFRGSTFGIATTGSSVYINDITIAGNHIADTTTDGMLLGEVRRLKLYDNHITVASGDVIDFAGSDGVVDISFRHQYQQQTTDATATTLVSLFFEDNTAVHSRMRAVAIGFDGTDRALYGIGALHYRDGGNVTLQGTAYDQFTAIESDATWGGPTLVISTNDLQHKITGVAAQTINWTVDMEIK